MYTRVQNKIVKEKKKWFRRNVPFVGQTTYQSSTAQWYEPNLVGPRSLAHRCETGKVIKELRAFLDKLSSDNYLEFLKNFYQNGLEKYGDSWVYADILTVLYGISNFLNIESYLEIGVRRGRSLSIVAGLNPKAKLVGADMWIQAYSGMENPGPDFVESELKKVGFQGEVSWLNGNSRKTIPAYFKKNPNVYFDLITVDGDHSKIGAAADLRNVIPHLKIGGVLVFDDIVSQEHPYLLKVWEKEVKLTGRFMTYEFTEVGLGVAFAIKKY